MSDDTPTQRFDQQPSGPGGNGTGAPDERKKRGPLIPILITVGALLLVVVVVLAVVLLTKPSTSTLALNTNTPSASPSAAPTASNSASASPTPTPTATHTTAPPPPSTTLAITSFLVNNSTAPVIYCNTSAPDPQPINISFSWTTQNSTNVYWGVDTADAQSGGSFANLPADGTNANFPSGIQTQTYPCPQHQETYTLTIVNNSGGKVNRSVTLVNKGDQM